MTSNSALSLPSMQKRQFSTPTRIYKNIIHGHPFLNTGYNDSMSICSLCKIIHARCVLVGRSISKWQWRRLNMKCRVRYSPAVVSQI